MVFYWGDKRAINSVIIIPVMQKKLIGLVRLDNPDIKKASGLFPIFPLIGGYLGSIHMNYQKEDILEQHQILLKDNNIKLEKEREFLDVLCRDFTSVYYVNLMEDTIEPLKLDQVANAARFENLTKRNTQCYTQMIHKYASEFVVPAQADKFDNISCICKIKPAGTVFKPQTSSPVAVQAVAKYFQERYHLRYEVL